LNKLITPEADDRAAARPLLFNQKSFGYLLFAVFEVEAKKRGTLEVF
jgi:hypothetical protein